MLAVIAIIGILAAIALPNLKAYKPNTMSAATRMLLDDINRARRLAISQRTTVYMVFVPSEFWKEDAFKAQSVAIQARTNNLVDKQLVGYTFVTMRKVGDQPGARNPDYLGPWRTLPQGVFIVPDKFTKIVPPRFVLNHQGRRFDYDQFNTIDQIPFPAPEAVGPPYVKLPYIAFNYLGQLVSKNQTDEVIPLAMGSVGIARDPATKKAGLVPVSLTENPPGNSISSFNLIYIDWLTGRPRVETMELQ